MSLKTYDDDKVEKKLMREMRKLDKSFVTIGVHKGAGSYRTGVSVAAVAAFNEFGTSHMPSRPFMRSTIDVNRNLLKKKNAEEFGAIMGGERTAKKALDRMGFLIKTLIEQRIQRSATWAVPNTPKVQQRKRKGGALRGPTPLINSGLLSRSITFKTTIRGR